MNRPKLLDLFCCQGGASVGYHRAGFDVVGVDIDPQPHYPFEFVQMDAIEALAAAFGPQSNEASVQNRSEITTFLASGEFDAIHASPPCQAFTNAQKLQGNAHPDYIAPVRKLLQERRIPYVIENVPGAPLLDPIELCGAAFGLATYRHRLFESNVTLWAPAHPEHVARTTKMGRRPVEGEFMHVVGNFSGVDKARDVMGMPWATRDGLREAIPPAYTEHIGRQLIAHIETEKAA